MNLPSKTSSLLLRHIPYGCTIDGISRMCRTSASYDWHYKYPGFGSLGHSRALAKAGDGNEWFPVDSCVRELVPSLRLCFRFFRSPSLPDGQAAGAHAAGKAKKPWDQTKLRPTCTICLRLGSVSPGHRVPPTPASGTPIAQRMDGFRAGLVRGLARADEKCSSHQIRRMTMRVRRCYRGKWTFRREFQPPRFSPGILAPPHRANQQI